jgi:hypothetical protein
VLSLTEYNPGEDEVLKRLFRRFHLERPRTPRTGPAWDLGLVLHQFTLPPFTQGEPLSDRNVPLRLLLCKLTFLLALASGGRRGELHALSRKKGDYRIVRDPDTGGEIAILRPFPGFLAKTQLPEQIALSFQVPSLAHLVPGEPERFLCPVRALKRFVKRTSDPAFLKGREALLVHHDEKIQKTKASHISKWIVDAITIAYQHAPDKDLPELGVKAHETRAVAHSLAYYNHATLTDVLAGARWKQASTFAGHYLRNMSECEEGEHRLLPVVAAGRVILPQQH